MTVSKIQTASPTEIDTALAEIDGRWFQAQFRAASIQKSINMYGREKKRIDQGLANKWDIEGYERAMVKYEAQMVETVALIEAIAAERIPFDAEWQRRGGWTRFFQVPGGHVHSSMACQTCNRMGKRTQFGWLPEWSGRSEAEALAALVTASAKTILCTVCFPNAPVEWTVERADPTVCPGSGTTDYGKSRRGYYTGNWGECSHCGERVTIVGQSGIKLRKHPKKA
jgi:hypothetical protein